MAHPRERELDFLSLPQEARPANRTDIVRAATGRGPSAKSTSGTADVSIRQAYTREHRDRRMIDGFAEEIHRWEASSTKAASGRVKDHEVACHNLRGQSGVPACDRGRRRVDIQVDATTREFLDPPLTVICPLSISGAGASASTIISMRHTNGAAPDPGSGDLTRTRLHGTDEKAGRPATASEAPCPRMAAPRRAMRNISGNLIV